MYTVLSDEELIRKMREGDEMAEEALLKRYKPLVLSRARAFYLTGGDRDDLVQEGMLGCYKAVCSFDKEKDVSFASFADLCIRRQIYSAVKLSNRKKHLPLNSSLSLDSPSDKESTSTVMESLNDIKTLDPEQLFIGQESFEEIAAAINSDLSKMEKQVLSLYLSGQSYQQIAAELNKPVKSVDNAIQRMKKKLEKYL